MVTKWIKCAKKKRGELENDMINVKYGCMWCHMVCVITLETISNYWIVLYLKKF
jgi:hypothetical protein